MTKPAINKALIGLVCTGQSRAVQYWDELARDERDRATGKLRGSR